MNIMIIDDSREDTDCLVNTLEEIYPSAEIVCIDNPDEAYKYAESSVPDILFSETKINNTSCTETVSLIKKLKPALNIVFCSEDSSFMADAIYMHASGYIIKPLNAEKIKRETDNLLYPVKTEIITFGNFGVFHNGVPVSFRRSKSMEVLAFLVDRRTACTKKQIAACIFEDRMYDRSCQKYLDNILHDLKEDLTAAGAGNLIIHKNNMYAVNRNNCICDYYDYLDGKKRFAFSGEYMTQYSWAEDSVANISENK